MLSLPGPLACHACVQAAKSAGQALRSFQPTIREVVSVTSELKGTIEQVRYLDCY